ncbi:MAG: outer membrane protein [Xanthobacteraceae bacterium]|jgi:outer membrane immunogenic protein
MFRKLLIGAVGALSMMGMASAADLPVKGPVYKAVPAPVFNWSGFYVGVSGGWAKFDTKFTNPPVTTGDFSDSGWLIGGTIGWNWQAPGSSFVWGLEADLSYVDVTAMTTVNCGGTCIADVKALGTVRARAGLAADNWLFFVTGGLAGARIDYNVANAFFNSETLWGWTVGGGVEVAFARRWSAKLEYLFIDLENGTIPVGPGGVVSADPSRMHIVRAGLNYRW